MSKNAPVADAMETLMAAARKRRALLLEAAAIDEQFKPYAITPDQLLDGVSSSVISHPSESEVRTESASASVLAMFEDGKETVTLKEVSERLRAEGRKTSMYVVLHKMVLSKQLLRVRRGVYAKPQS